MGIKGGFGLGLIINARGRYPVAGQIGFHPIDQIEVTVTTYSFKTNKSCENLELLSNLVFEACWSCGDLVWVCGFNSVFERDACDNFGEIVKAA